MPKLDTPIKLTFGDSEMAHSFIKTLNLAEEQIIWEQNITEAGTVIVRILNIIDPIEEMDNEE